MSRPWPLLLLLVCLAAAPAAAAPPASPPQPVTLAAALARAEADSNTIAEARARLAARQADLAGAKAARLPTLSTGYSYARLGEEPYRVFAGQQVVVGDQDNFHGDLTVSQPLFTGFALSTRKEMAAIGVDIEAMELERARLEVAQEVKNAYYRVLLAGRVLTVANEEVSQLTAHADNARHFLDQGMIPENDLLKAQVALAEARQQAQRAMASRGKAVAAFNLLLSLPLTQATAVADEPGDEHAAAPALAPLITEALATRPEVRAMQLMVAKAGQATRLAASAFYPQVDLVGRLQRDTENGDLTTNDYANRDTSSVMVEARWQLFDWGKRRAEVSSRRSEQHALAARLHQLEDTVRLEVQNALLDRQVAAANITTAQAALAQARENFRLTTLQYRESLASSTDVIDARTFVTRAETDYYSARYGLRLADAALERAVGRLPAAATDQAPQKKPAAAPTSRGDAIAQGVTP